MADKVSFRDELIRLEAIVRKLEADDLETAIDELLVIDSLELQCWIHRNSQPATCRSSVTGFQQRHSQIAHARCTCPEKGKGYCRLICQRPH